MRRLPGIVALALLLLLAALAGDALAQAGGGSSGYGGGGGGGGGYGGGGSGGINGWAVLAIIIIVVVLVGTFVVRRALFKRRVREREAGVQTAAAEAAQDDPAFAAETVRAEGWRLFMDAQHAWDERDREALRRIVGPELMVEWERRLHDFERKGWRNRVWVDGESASRSTTSGS